MNTFNFNQTNNGGTNSQSNVGTADAVHNSSTYTFNDYPSTTEQNGTRSPPHRTSSQRRRRFSEPTVSPFRPNVNASDLLSPAQDLLAGGSDFSRTRIGVAAYLMLDFSSSKAGGWFGVACVRGWSQVGPEIIGEVRKYLGVREDPVGGWRVDVLRFFKYAKYLLTFTSPIQDILKGMSYEAFVQFLEGIVEETGMRGMYKMDVRSHLERLHSVLPRLGADNAMAPIAFDSVVIACLMADYRADLGKCADSDWVPRLSKAIEMRKQFYECCFHRVIAMLAELDECERNYVWKTKGLDFNDPWIWIVERGHFFLHRPREISSEVGFMENLLHNSNKRRVYFYIDLVNISWVYNFPDRSERAKMIFECVKSAMIEKASHVSAPDHLKLCKFLSASKVELCVPATGGLSVHFVEYLTKTCWPCKTCVHPGCRQAAEINDSECNPHRNLRLYPAPTALEEANNDSDDPMEGMYDASEYYLK